MTGASKGIMRVTNHPRKDDWLVLKFGPELNGLIHTFGPAQQALDLGGYVMHRDQLGALQQWGRYNAVQMMVEVRAYGEPTQAVECGNVISEDGEKCAAPYPASRVPKFCGACGQPAKPVIFAAADVGSGVRCPACDRVNHGGPAYCLSCAAPLPERHLAAPALARSKGEPRPLGEALHELATHIAHDAAHAARARNALHTHNGDHHDNAE